MWLLACRVFLAAEVWHSRSHPPTSRPIQVAYGMRTIGMMYHLRLTIVTFLLHLPIAMCQCQTAHGKIPALRLDWCFKLACASTDLSCVICHTIVILCCWGGLGQGVGDQDRRHAKRYVSGLVLATHPGCGIWHKWQVPEPGSCWGCC